VIQNAPVCDRYHNHHLLTACYLTGNGERAIGNSKAIARGFKSLPIPTALRQGLVSTEQGETQLGNEER